MKKNTIKIRLMETDDFNVVVGIDEKVLKSSRPEYYQMKFERLFESEDFLPMTGAAESGRLSPV